MADIIFKIDHNKIFNKPTANSIFYSIKYSNQSLSPNNTINYSFINSTNDIIYVAVLRIKESATQYYYAPIIVSKNQDAVCFNAKLNSTTPQTVSSPAGSVQFDGETYYYGKVIGASPYLVSEAKNPIIINIQDSSLYISEIDGNIDISGDCIVYQAQTTYNNTTSEYDIDNIEDVVLDMLADESKYTFSKDKLLNIEYLSQSSPNPNEIFYGIVSNKGNVELLDIDNEILTLVNDGTLKKQDLKCSVYVNNNLITKGIIVGKNYSIKEKKLQISFTSGVDLLSNISYDRQYFSNLVYTSKDSYETKEDISVYDLMIDLMSKSNIQLFESNVDFSDYAISYDFQKYTIDNYLKGLVIQYPYIKKDTSLNVLNHLCQLAQINFIEEGGNLKAINARPVYFDDIIVVPKSKQYSKFDYSLIPNNSKDNIEIKTTLFQNEADGGYISDALIYNDIMYIGEYQNYNGTTGTNNGLNKEKYDDVGGLYPVIPTGSTGESFYTWFQFNYSFSPKETNEILDFRREHALDMISISIKGKTVGGSQININLQGSENILGEFTILPYHQVYQPTAYEEIPNIYEVVKDDVDNVIKIRCQINCGYATSKLESIELKIYGNDKYIVTNKDILFGNSNGNNNMIIDNNELFEWDEISNGNIVTSNFANNILDDYSKGISDGTITVSYGDYYDKNGNKVVNGEKGEIIKVGSVIEVEGNDKIWKVTGVNLRKKGVPFIDLQVVETYKATVAISVNIGLADCIMKLNRIYSDNKNATLGEIPNDSILYLNDIIKINIIPTISISIGSISSTSGDYSYIQASCSQRTYVVGDLIEYNGDVAEVTAVLNNSFTIKVENNGEIYNSANSSIQVENFDFGVISSLKINNVDYDNDSEYTILDNISISAVCLSKENDFNVIYMGDLDLSFSSDDTTVLHLPIEGFEELNASGTNYVKMTGIINARNTGSYTCLIDNKYIQAGYTPLEYIKFKVGDSLSKDVTQSSSELGNVKFELKPNGTDMMNYINKAVFYPYGMAYARVYFGRIKNCKIVQHK